MQRNSDNLNIPEVKQTITQCLVLMVEQIMEKIIGPFQYLLSDQNNAIFDNIQDLNPEKDSDLPLVTMIVSNPQDVLKEYINLHDEKGKRQFVNLSF